MAVSRKDQFSEILGNLKKKIYAPVYFLHGEEPFYIDLISDFIEENVLSDVEKEFNQTVIYGKETDVATIRSYARRYPMMSNYQVVIVREAQNLGNIEELQSYVEEPVPSTLLVLCHKYKKIDGRTAFAKNLSKHAVLFESAKIYDDQVPDWIVKYVEEKKYGISPKAAILLADFLGNDLSRIVNEITKLIINLKPGSEITDKIIESNIGISKEFNIFEFQKALGKKDVVKANQIINYFGANQKTNPLAKVIPMLFSFYSKILLFHEFPDKNNSKDLSIALGVNPFFLNDFKLAARNYTREDLVKIMSILRDYDLKSKGVDNLTAKDGELGKELVFRLLHS